MKTHLVLVQRSADAGRRLMLLLLAGVILSIAVVTGRAIELLLPEAGGIILPWIRGAEIAMLVAIVLSAVQLIAWMVQLHADFQDAFPGYPISVAAARRLIMTPGYNLYGLFHLFFVLGGYLREKHAELRGFEDGIRIWMPWVVGVIAATLLWALSASTHLPVDAQTYVIGLGLLPVLFSLALGMTVSTTRVIERALRIQSRMVEL